MRKAGLVAIGGLAVAIGLLEGCSYLPASCGGTSGPEVVTITPPKPSHVQPPPPQPTDPDAPPTALEPANCADLQDGGPVEGPGCVTKKITCNSTTVGHTLGGSNALDTKFYERHKCTPATTNHDGGDERVYHLEMPEGDHRVIAWLDTPCADLDLTVMSVRDPTRCPTFDDGLLQVCDMWPRDRNEREKVEIATQGKTDVFVVVEGKGKDEGAFALTVECKDGLH